jgi:rhodanese-related sulfurtransferase
MTSVFDSCKLRINGITYVCPAEVPELLKKGARLVDIREDFEIFLKTFSVEDIIYLPFKKLKEDHSSLPVDVPLIVADSVGLWSKEAVLYLKTKGYENIVSLAGGIADWERDGLPLKNSNGQQLNGPCLCMLKPQKQ